MKDVEQFARRASPARRAKLRSAAVESRAIQLTAIVMLSVFAVIAGLCTFAIAQREYREMVRDDLARTLRDRRAFLDYAIREHLQQATLGAQPVIASSAATTDDAPDAAALQKRLQVSAEALVDSGFSGWRFVVGDTGVTAGTFIEHPEFAIPLVGRHATDLLLKDGRYFLRTRIALNVGVQAPAYAIAEESFPELGRMMLEADGWGTTGSLVLCGTQDGDMACLPSRNNVKATRIRPDVDGQPLPISLALDQEIGIREMQDFRRQRVLAAYGPVGFTGLGMVMKIDMAELYAPLAARFRYAAVLLGALVAAGVWLLRRRLRPLTQALVDAREEAARVAAQFKGAAESSLDAYFLLEAVRDAKRSIVDFRIVYVNASGEALVSRPTEELVGRTLTAILPHAQALHFIARYAEIVTGGASLTEDFRLSATDAKAPWVAHQAVRLGDGVCVTARDITRTKAVERQLRSKAENDVLTELPNRALFFDRLSRALAQARDTGHAVGVLFLDVDRFKTINDTHGHAAGDAVLVEFAKRLRSALRASDTVARLGGDEFAILLPKLDGVAPAERIATDILASIAVPFAIGALHVKIGTSIGVALSTRHDTPEALVGRADRKLYQAKAAGRGRFSSAGERRAA
ncbi:MAG TPA: diguanylate cyclase [Casimicrobiaceae bacterium]|nr:diguanylate cyclase [Casimicrobiaceae bacterium]